jgi:hypothetical protein
LQPSTSKSLLSKVVEPSSLIDKGIDNRAR